MCFVLNYIHWASYTATQKVTRAYWTLLGLKSVHCGSEGFPVAHCVLKGSTEATDFTDGADWVRLGLTAVQRIGGTRTYWRLYWVTEGVIFRNVCYTDTSARLYYTTYCDLRHCFSRFENITNIRRIYKFAISFC